MRLLALSEDEVARFRADIRKGDRHHVPGAVRASCGINTTDEDIQRLLIAVAQIAVGGDPPFSYVQDPTSGDFIPDPVPGWYVDPRSQGRTCSPG
jgi:hypothetical protein